jgi:hypothetical protein
MDMTKIANIGSAKWRWMSCLAAAAMLAGRAHAQDYSSDYNADWARNFRIGGFAALNIKANLSMSGQFAISGHPAGVYDDGYVLVDQTGNARDLTSNWGYHNASQYNAGAQTLTMHNATSYTATGGMVNNDNQVYAGFEAAYGGTLWQKGRWRVGWEAGFGLLPIEFTHNSSLSATVNRSAVSFDTGSIVMPTAPYNGGPSGVGPLMHDTPTALPGDTIAATINGVNTLDADLYTLRLGPTLFWDFTDYLGLSISAGGAIGFVSGDLKFDETISLADGSTAQNRGKVSGTDTTYGGYVNATITYHAVKNGDFYVGVQYMPLGNASISGGGRQAKLDLSGQLYISAGFNWPF